jgi:hypothetical protein
MVAKHGKEHAEQTFKMPPGYELTLSPTSHSVLAFVLPRDQWGAIQQIRTGR